MKEIQSTAIIGMGALGLLYGNQIVSRLGSSGLRFIADRKRIQKYHSMEFTVNGEHRTFPMEDCETAAPADFVIVAVKYNALPEALNTMKNCVGPDTTIISVMNGISSEQMIGERYGREKVLYSIAQGMDAMKFGSSLTYTQAGELRVGALSPEQNNRLEAMTAFFDRAGIAYTVEDDILQRLWGKFMLNVGVNQTCMAYETTYSGTLVPGEAHDTMIGAMREVIRLAHAEHVNLTEQDLDSYIDLLKTLSPDGMPSMRQDSLSHRPSEVEMFSGTVREMAKKHGLATPVNDRLYKRIREMESQYT
ncbi:ketopantoate reductase family protein [Hungatella hathewayi]|uniref:ketopantoate reductase family protein n=1 Tax=Hungatella hathewayi TaxID=154046 RepID=UPI002A839C29|nr:ketopantoate reductase family protein [Hungatella hathewayi]